MMVDHNSFIVNGKTINVKDKVKRQDTPNYVEQWAQKYNIDLKAPRNPDAIKKR